MARDVVGFIGALELDSVDLHGLSIGSFVAQEIALRGPALVRRGPRLIGPARRRRDARLGVGGIAAIGAPARNPDGHLGVFFTGSATIRQAGVEHGPVNSACHRPRAWPDRCQVSEASPPGRRR